MDAIFPLGFPVATGFYLVLYVVTLAIHVVFMNYVLAGTAYLAYAAMAKGRGLFGGAPGHAEDQSPLPPYSEGEGQGEGGSRAAREPHTAAVGSEMQSPVGADPLSPNPSPPSTGERGAVRPASVLIDWMPVFLSGAITAGIAPLLFVQILYKREFYTANLLLFNRWMSILPVLIVGFYALYLLKTTWIQTQSRLRIALIGLVPFLCVAFTGYSWTENHLLSVRGTAYWSVFYREDPTFYFEPQLIPRLLVWAFGSLATLAVLVAWQLWYLERGGKTIDPRTPRNLALTAAGGMALTVAAAFVYLQVAGDVPRQAFFGAMAAPYLAAAVLGMLLQAGGWVLVWMKGRLVTQLLAVASVGLALTLVGMTVCRETVRIHTLGETTMQSLTVRHTASGQVGGLIMFLVFFTLNAVLVGLCFVLVRRGRKTDEAPA